MSTPDDSDDLTHVGDLEFVIVDLDETDDPAELLDDIEADLGKIARAIFDPSTGELDDELDEQLEPLGSRILILNRVTLADAWRGFGLGTVLTGAAIKVLSGDDRIAIRLRLDELAQFSPEITRWLPILRAAIDRHAITFRLNAGQGYILDNYRWLHGRRAFTGQRVMYRVNGNPLPHLGITPGFQPTPILTPSNSSAAR